MTKYYTYDPEEGFDVYDSAEKAEKACEANMQFYVDAAARDGWHEDLGALEWGHLVPHATAQCVQRGDPTDEYPDGTEEWALVALET